MTNKICLFNWETAVGQAQFACFSDYVLYGIILILIGFLMVSFIPLMTPKKVGVGLIILGLVMAVGINFIKNLWYNNPTFQIIVYSVIVFVIVMIIIFAEGGNDEVKT